METTFKTTILGFGNNTGIEVPLENLDELGSGKRAPVVVQINNYSYKSTVAVMSGKYLISLPKVHRDAAGLKAGDDITVKLELDAGVRSVEIPSELGKVLKQTNLLSTFEKLAYSKRKEFCRQVTEAKTEETMQRRITKIVDTMSLDIKI